MIEAVGVNITGIVQGVGYRPFIYLAAVRHGLTGYVANKGGEVLIHIEGNPSGIKAFLSYIKENSPQSAHIHSIVTVNEAIKGFNDFKIIKSIDDKTAISGIPADVGICDDCRSDIMNPASRFYLYPFTSCTKCGPRFTIIHRLPYDRCNTTMEPFRMCKECEKEFSDPENRRYHAQTICCPECGPKIKLVDKSGYEITGDPFDNARAMLKQGFILAVKGIGGYHLVCDAADDKAVSKLRERKIRKYKPFAVMFKDLNETDKHCEITGIGKELLLGLQKPIVLLRQKAESKISGAVNPGLNRLGVMLPYSGIHLLLFDSNINAIVATSGNISGQPLITGDKDAIELLGGIADAFLVHNREILRPCDDSVVKPVLSTVQFLRRGRGYAPLPILLDSKNKERQILSVGADLKNTFCTLKDGRAYISQHMGELNNLESLKIYKENIKKYRDVLDFTPDIVAHDMHPDYITTKFANEVKIPAIQVQHHHAHIASVLTENNFDGQVIGVAFDGTGFGPDQTVWGGEFFIATLEGYIRTGHLRQVFMPGGEMAVRQPWRMAGAYLQDTFGESFMDMDIPCVKELSNLQWPVLWKSVKYGLNKMTTSSAGRLFDAVSAILGVCYYNDYEGQASAKLESIANDEDEIAYEYEIYEEQTLTADFRKTIKGIISDVMNGKEINNISGIFHNTISRAIADICMKIREKDGINTIALGGGVFQNQLLLEKSLKYLSDSGFKVLINKLIPCNDGGISLGQAAVVAAKLSTYR